MLLEGVERLQLSVAVEEDPALEEVGNRLGNLVVRKAGGGQSKDPVELFQRTLLGLGNPEQDHKEGNDVETSVETKGTNNVESVKNERECHSQNGGPEQASSNRETHTHLTMRKRVDLGGVSEGYRTLARGVKGAEKVDEERHQRSAGHTRRNQRAKTSRQ